MFANAGHWANQGPWMVKEEWSAFGEWEGTDPKAKGLFSYLPLTGVTTDSKGQLSAYAITRDSAGTYIDTAGVLQTADGDETGSTNSLENETDYTSMRGSFVDAAPWFEGENLGAALWNDDCADDDTGDYIEIDCTMAFSVDHYVITRTDASQFIYNDVNFTLTPGAIYKFTIEIKDGTASSEEFSIRIGNNSLWTDATVLYTADTTSLWTTHTAYFAALSTDDTVGIRTNFDAGNLEMRLFKLEPVTAINDMTDGNLLIADDGSGNKAYGFIETDQYTNETLGSNLFDQDGGSGGSGDKGGFNLTDLRNAELSSGNLTVGTMYEISAQDGEDFTADGAPDNVVGTTFVATGTNVTLDANDKAYPIDISWVPWGANTMEIDSDSLKITYVDNGGGAYLYFSDAKDLSADLEIGKQYKLTFDAKVNEGMVQVQISESGASQGSVDIENTAFAPYGLYFTSLKTTLMYMQFFSMGGSEIIWLDNLVLTEVTAPAITAVKIYKEYSLTTEGWNALDDGIDYNAGATWDFDVYDNLLSDTGAGAEARIEANGLLSEGEGTNWCLYSNKFDEWSASGSVTEAQDVTGPDGVANSAWTVTDAGGGANQGLYIPLMPGSASGTYSYSVFVKEGTSSGLSLWLYDTTAPATRARVHFQWTAGVLSVKTDEVGTGSVEQIGSTSWWRATISAPSVVGGNAHSCYLYPTERGVDPGSAETTIFYGAQMEATPYATSYIPTTTIPTTRTVDAQSWTMSTLFKNLMGDVADSEFTMVCEFTPKHTGSYANSGIVSIRPSATSIMHLDADGTGADLIAYDGTSRSEITNPMITSGVTYILALRVFDDGGGDYDFKVGESHAGSWTWDASPATYDGSFNPSTDLIIGYGNEYPFNIKNIRFYNEAKTQAWIEANF